MTSRPRARYDAAAVQALFDEMAATYGFVNLVSSFGFTARWRHQVVEGLPLGAARRVLDFMSGMGELWRSLAPGLSRETRVIGVDISPEMVRRAPRDWRFSVEVQMADVLTWDLEPGSADVIVSSFGLKTFDRDQQRRLADKVAELLKPGGSFSFIEISVPPRQPLRMLYMLYLNWLIPLIGRICLGNPANYRLLGVYTEAFGDCGHFVQCLKDAGLDARFTSYFFGCATGARGTRQL